MPPCRLRVPRRALPAPRWSGCRCGCRCCRRPAARTARRRGRHRRRRRRSSGRSAWRARRWPHRARRRHGWRAYGTLGRGRSSSTPCDLLNARHCVRFIERSAGRQTGSGVSRARDPVRGYVEPQRQLGQRCLAPRWPPARPSPSKPGWGSGACVASDPLLFSAILPRSGRKSSDDRWRNFPSQSLVESGMHHYTVSPGETRDRSMSVLKRNNVTVDGAQGPFMVYAHGFGCDHTMWKRVATQFSTTHRVVLFD